ncbi:AGE family epimerase/isomerase [Rhodohalobacter sulfatireducens]|uniref:AGE family epimerase/isomerase n=1 Tax=Rhodohalobacter sulfatireducens TaxID=2911366 RepID=A0ABS9KGJ4_9BACT|nr:AGE family epimerase/isomerase [Rhodohalobacter sulfatireducens]MCG2589974.1 AGE family epimerase/isomerase [Rhodohalobacter sulfatireducens]
MNSLFRNIFSKKREVSADAETLSRLKDEIEQLLVKEVDAWYPASIDTSYGGFYTDLDYKFEPDGDQKKTIIHQARHLWAISRACSRYPSNNSYREYADHGFSFISQKFWNNKSGGFYTESDRNGVLVRTDIPMSAFGQSFAIYGIVAYHRVSQKPEALKLAIDTFHWLENYMYDKEFKGYFSYIDQNRKIIERPGVGSVLDGNCLKGVNSILHLVEAYTELYKIWPDPLLRVRISELLDLIQSKMIQPKGYLHNYFDKDWTPVRIKKRTKSHVRNFLYLEHVSFGHDAEAAFLMSETAKLLKNRNSNKTLVKAKLLTDHSVTYGLDRRKGGLFKNGYYFDRRRKPTPMDRSKIWWIQAEALYTFLLFSSLFPKDEQNYFEIFHQQLLYIKKYFIDYKYGGWFEQELDKSQKQKRTPKSHEWKATYHTYRALENCVELLDEML